MSLAEESLTFKENTAAVCQGPWWPDSLRQQALTDLAQMAKDMHGRQLHTDEILHALARQAGGWATRGAAIDDQDVLSAVRGVCPDYEPYRDVEAAIDRDRLAQTESVAPSGHAPLWTAAPSSMAGILLVWLRETYDPLHRRDQLLWSRTLGRTVDVREAGLGPATPLLARLLAASDCPRDREGAPSAAGILRVWRQHLGVAWADLLASLPAEAAAAEVDPCAEDELRRQLAALLGRIVSIGRRVAEGRETDVQSLSLLDCCLAWAVPGCWGRIRSYWLWCRLDGSEPLPTDPVEIRAERRRRLRVALRIELAGQLGVRPLSDWPAQRLTELCEHYGIAAAVRVGHDRCRAIELSRKYIADLLGDPQTDRQPGEEG